MRRDEDSYDTAQICLSGHMITDAVEDFPAHGRKFCGRCGRETITTCPRCKAKIRGHLRGVVSMGAGDDDVPAFCEDCGASYPWTSERIEAAKALADEIQELPEPDRIMLKTSIDQIATDTPMTEVAAMRIKKMIPKIGRVSAEALRKLLVDIASETAKKSMGL